MTALIVIVGGLAFASAIGVVAFKQTIYSALSLVLSVGMLGVIFLLLNAQFLFAVQIIIYAGAVMVLFVFIIALLSPSDEDRPRFDWRMVVGLAGVAAITLTVVFLARNGITYTTDSSGNVAFRGQTAGTLSNPYNSFAFTTDSVDAPNAGNIQTVGGQLFTVFLLPFEITSLLLLVAAVGAVYLTRRAPRAAN